MVADYGRRKWRKEGRIGCQRHHVVDGGRGAVNHGVGAVVNLEIDRHVGLQAAQVGNYRLGCYRLVQYQ